MHSLLSVTQSMAGTSCNVENPTNGCKQHEGCDSSDVFSKSHQIPERTDERLQIASDLWFGSVQTQVFEEGQVSGAEQEWCSVGWRGDDDVFVVVNNAPQGISHNFSSTSEDDTIHDNFDGGVPTGHRDDPNRILGANADAPLRKRHHNGTGQAADDKNASKSENGQAKRVLGPMEALDGMLTDVRWRCHVPGERLRESVNWLNPNSNSNSNRLRRPSLAVNWLDQTLNRIID